MLSRFRLTVALGLSCAFRMYAQVPGSVSGFSHFAPNLEVIVKSSDGAALPSGVIVQLIGVTGKLYDQRSVTNGKARFDSMPRDQYRVVVFAPGYQHVEKKLDLVVDVRLATVTLELQPIADEEEAAADRGLRALSPRAQKEASKALEALRKRKADDARTHLEAAQREAPNSGDVQYLFGVYAAMINNRPQALEYWNKTLELSPNHLSALLELGQVFIEQQKPGEAMPYLNRALTVEPSSWRAHALLAEADYLQNDREQAMKQAQRALDVGHERAATIQPLYAALWAESGNIPQAIRILEGYVKGNPSDSDAAKQLSEMKSSRPGLSRQSEPRWVHKGAVPELPSSMWMPPDVDEKTPPVDSGAACSLDEILTRTGKQLENLTQDLERFSATESLVDEGINKWGVPYFSEKRVFDYLVSIENIRPGLFGLDEYRMLRGRPAELPDGFVTDGLPALVMVFHPFFVKNYEITCEGLARHGDGFAWQVHFRQRPDKPMQLRGFRAAMGGSSHPAALKGRAWISAESYQIVRLETDLVASMPEIHLVAEHAAIEYASVKFPQRGEELWLPRSAEVHFDWMGQRIHRTHLFDNYMLFAVDEQQRINSPKGSHPPAFLPEKPK